jgi:hypothetical protein
MSEIAGPVIAILRHAPWYAAVVGAIALILAMARSVRRRRKAAEARVRTALAAAPPDELRDGELAAIRGALDAERAITSVAALGFGGGRELCELGHASADAVVVSGDQRIALDGPIAVVVGSHVIRHHTLPTSHFEAAVILRDRARRSMQLDLWPSAIDAYHLRRVKPGDEVIARGRLRRTDDGWALVAGAGTVEVAAIELTAIAAVVDPVPAPPMGTLARSVLVGVAAWLLVAWIAYAV